MAQTALQGNPVQLSGDLPAVGSSAPDFSLTAGDLSDVSLATYAGKKKLSISCPVWTPASAPLPPRSSTT